MRRPSEFVRLKIGDRVKVTDKYGSLAGSHKKWNGYIVTVEETDRDNDCHIKEFRENGVSGFIPRDRLEKISFELPEELFEI